MPTSFLWNFINLRYAVVATQSRLRALHTHITIYYMLIDYRSSLYLIISLFNHHREELYASNYFYQIKSGLQYQVYSRDKGLTHFTNV